MHHLRILSKSFDFNIALYLWQSFFSLFISPSFFLLQFSVEIIMRLCLRRNAKLMLIKGEILTVIWSSPKGEWTPEQRGPRRRIYGGQQQQAECERDWRTALLPLRMESDDAAFRPKQSDGFRTHNRRTGISSWSTYTCLHLPLLLLVLLFFHTFHHPPTHSLTQLNHPLSCVL